LSAKGGQIEVSWLIQDGVLFARWHESGGPAVAEPKHFGFGRVLLERMLKSDPCSEATLQFAASGLKCELSLPLGRNT
jgi:two-component sensor histidine kinase